MKVKKANLSIKDLLSLQDINARQIISVLKLAKVLKKKTKCPRSRQLLRGKIVGMIFQKPSTRTRVSFEAGIYQMGGNAVSLNYNDIQLSRGESIEDTARTLSLYLDCIMARVYDHTDVQKLANFANIPVINGLSDSFHPCQALADLLTISEYKGQLKGLNLAWIGDGNNVCNDLLLGCAKTGINMTVACPKNYRPADELIELAKYEAELTSAKVMVVEDPTIAAKDADVIVTDTFLSIGKENESDVREPIFLFKYQVNRELMKLTKRDAIFMHCLPVNRGKEVTSEVIDGNSSVVWSEAENRMHVQKAILLLLMKPNISL